MSVVADCAFVPVPPVGVGSELPPVTSEPVSTITTGPGTAKGTSIGLSTYSIWVSILMTSTSTSSITVTVLITVSTTVSTTIVSNGTAYGTSTYSILGARYTYFSSILLT